MFAKDLSHNTLSNQTLALTQNSCNQGQAITVPHTTEPKISQPEHTNQTSIDPRNVDYPNLNVFHFSPELHYPANPTFSSSHSDAQPEFSQGKLQKAPQTPKSNDSHQYSSEIGSQDSKKLTCQEKCKLNREKLMEKWTTAQEKFLIAEVSRQKNDWKKVAKHFSKKFNTNATAFFLRSQYTKIRESNPTVEESKFTHIDDVRIVELTQKMGLDWIKIAEVMGIQNPVRIKNRYYAHIKKKNKLDGIFQEIASKKGQQANPLKQIDQLSSYDLPSTEPAGNDFNIFSQIQEPVTIYAAQQEGLGNYEDKNFQIFDFNFFEPETLGPIDNKSYFFEELNYQFQ